MTGWQWENIAWAIGSCFAVAVAFYSTQSFHSLWIFPIVGLFLNSPTKSK